MSGEPEGRDAPPPEQAYLNTDRELWRERPGDYYADHIFVTREGAIGIACGGHVVVMPVRDWHSRGSSQAGSAPAERFLGSDPQDPRSHRLTPEYLKQVLRELASDNDAAATDVELHIGALEAELADLRGAGSAGSPAPGLGLNDPETAEYPVLVRAYLAVETALAKRILADRNRANRERGEPRNWPAQQEWDELGQTSHETFWSAARKEAGLPTEGAFKNEVILGASSPSSGEPQ